MKKIRLIILLAICLFIAYTIFLFSAQNKQPELPILGKVNNFHLFDETGKEFTLQDLKGDIWIANFFFTTCGDICPIMTKNMAALHRSFELVDGVKHISITVNPEFDSSNILKKYSEKYGANPMKWHFLTGSRGQIKELAVESFKLGSIEEPVFHSAQFVLVDHRGLIRGYYDGVQAGEVSQLFQDVSYLLKEK